MALIHMKKPEYEHLFKKIQPLSENYKTENFQFSKEKRCFSGNFDLFNLSSKNTFLPRLPDKSGLIKLGSSHLVNDFYVEAENDKEKSSRKNSALCFKGDLLKASQVYQALKSSISETMKHVKTADSPWSRPLDEPKPLRSTLRKNTTEISSFSIKQNVKSEPKNQSCSSLHVNKQLKENMMKKGELERGEALNKTQSNNDLAEKCLAKTEKSAEEIYLENTKNILLSYKNSNKEKEQNTEADVALHALDIIWELHSFVLINSPFLCELYKKTIKKQTTEAKKALFKSKKLSKLNLGADKFEEMVHLELNIDDALISRHAVRIALAVALYNLYQPSEIRVPLRFAPGTFAAACLFKCEPLISSSMKAMANSLSRKSIGDLCKAAEKYENKAALELCHNWLEMNLMPQLGSSDYLKYISSHFFTKVIKSKKLFVINEFDVLVSILNWIFFYLNPSANELPTQSALITYFSSLSKENCLVEKHSIFKEILYSVRLHGITKSNQIHTIQQMNIYPNSFMVRVMLEIQQSYYHGGDMNISRTFDSAAIRHGFSMSIEQNKMSEIFTLYGFHFELIAEKVDDCEEKSAEESASTQRYRFFIQRLNIKDPILTYQQSQLEIFSLRNDRLCTYAICVYYWCSGRQNIMATGLKQHRFGKDKSQACSFFDLQIPVGFEHDKVKEINVMFSILYPID